MGKGNRPTTFSSVVINNINLQIGVTVSPQVQLAPGLSFLRAEIDVANHTNPASFLELECDISYDGGVSWPVDKVTNDQCIFFAPSRQGGVVIDPETGSPLTVMSTEFNLFDPVSGAPRQSDANTYARLQVTLTTERLRTGGTIYGG
jgi:hypothetical protein